MKTRIAAIVLSAAALSGCAGGTSGAAAVVNGQAITEEQVSAMAQSARSQLEQVPAGQLQDVPSLTQLGQMAVDRLVLHALFLAAASAKGFEVTDEQVNTMISSVYAQYGEDNIKLQLVSQNGVAESAIPDFVRDVIIQQQLAAILAPGADEAAQNAALVSFMGETAKAVGVEVSPRFGAWDPMAFQSTGLDEVLSKPAAS